MAAPETHGATEAHGVFPPFDPQYFGSQLFWPVSYTHLTLPTILRV